MSMSRVMMVLLVLSAWASSSPAETLLPDVMRQADNAARTAAPADGDATMSFLVDATARMPGLGGSPAATPWQALRWALPESPQEADPAELLADLMLLGQDRVSIAYFQALAEPSLFTAHAGNAGPAPADRPRPTARSRPAVSTLDGVRPYSAAAAAKAVNAEPGERWALANELASDLWLYLVALAVIAAAALRLARPSRGGGRYRTRRLIRL